MPLVLGPGLVAAALLALAGAQKLLDPTMTVGGLRALGVRSSPLLVRAGSTAELMLAAAAVSVDLPQLWFLVAASYLAFAVFVTVAMRRGTMIGSCGCFGREDTPPHAVHVVANVALAAAALGAATLDEAAVTFLAEGGAWSGALVALGSLAVYLLHAVYVQVPRTLRAGTARG